MPFKERSENYGNVWRCNFGNTRYDSEEFWQFRVSILPTEANINKAFTALNNKLALANDHPDIKLAYLRDNEINLWDGTLSDGSDRDQRGKELCVYMDRVQGGTNFAFSEEYIKGLMLTIWKILEDAGVEISYITPTNAEKEMASDTFILTPFTYSSFKPYESADGILHANEYNPNKYEKDPLKGVFFSHADLKNTGIKNYNALSISASRLDYMNTHYKKAMTRLYDRIDSLAQTHSTYESEKAKLDNLIKNPEKISLKKQNIDLIAEAIASYFPSDFTKGARVSLFDNQEIEKLINNDNLTKERLKDLYTIASSRAETIIQETTQRLQNMTWPITITKPSNDQIASLVNDHPHEMQAIERQFIHLEHEQQAIAKEQARYDSLKAKTKALAITKTALKTARIGSATGAIIGVGIGAALVTTGLFAPVGAGVLGILAVSATIGLASSVLGALFIGLTSLLIETFRYKESPTPVASGPAPATAPSTAPSIEPAKPCPIYGHLTGGSSSSSDNSNATEATPSFKQ